MSSDLDPRGIGWLASLTMGLLAVGDPQIAEFKSGLKPHMKIPGTAGRKYQTYLTSSGSPLVQSNTFRLYICEIEDGRFGVLKVSANVSRDGESLPIAKIQQNTKLVRKEAQLLTRMRQESIVFDEWLVSVGKESAYHHSFFPAVVDSFETGDGRYAIVLGYPEAIKTLAELSAVTQLMGKPGARKRIDLKSAWIFGKLLKVLNYAHKLGILNNSLFASNVLISQAEHAVILFDWRNATQEEELTVAQQRREIQQAASIFVEFAGGKWDGEVLTLPHDTELMTVEEHEQFVAFFVRIFKGVECGTAYDEHTNWYALLDSVWARGFHDFTLYPLSD